MINNDAARKSIYAVAIAALGVFAVYGFLNDQQVEAFGGLVLALTNLLAYVNVGEGRGTAPVDPDVEA